jgi:hypothetical protein
LASACLRVWNEEGSGRVASRSTHIVSSSTLRLYLPERDGREPLYLLTFIFLPSSADFIRQPGCHSEFASGSRSATSLDLGDERSNQSSSSTSGGGDVGKRLVNWFLLILSYVSLKKCYISIRFFLFADLRDYLRAKRSSGHLNSTPSPPLAVDDQIGIESFNFLLNFCLCSTS